MVVAKLKRQIARRAAIVIVLLAFSQGAFGFQVGDRWKTTANGDTGAQGDPITLTFGIVPDGTPISSVVAGESSEASSLISFMDTKSGYGSNGATVQDRLWFFIFDDSFTRWSQLGGVSYSYEPNDDGIDIRDNPVGSLGIRPDIRIGGHSIDGTDGQNTLAYNYFPDHADMVIDTDNGDFYGNQSNNSLGVRNVVMHEHGHGLGINHLISDDSRQLMEPFISTAFEGPQIDDIQALHRNHGDVNEKAGGNDTFGTATQLGSLSAISSVSVGESAAELMAAPDRETFEWRDFDLDMSSVGLAMDPASIDLPSLLALGEDARDLTVGGSDIDFVSIDDNTDTDFYSFFVTGQTNVNVILTPLGPTYNEAPQTDPETPQTPFDSSAQSDLTLQVLDTDGTTPLATANATGLGGTESILDLNINAPEFATSYFVRVTGAQDLVQLYHLDLNAVATPIPLPPAVWTGLSMLGAMAVMQGVRNRKAG